MGLDKLLVGALLLGGCASTPARGPEQHGQYREMLTYGGHDLVWTLRGTEGAFQELQKHGYDMNKQHLFQYTFVSPRLGDLDNFALALSTVGFEKKSLELDPDGMWYLTIQRPDVHTPASMHMASVGFSKLAEKAGVQYQEWRVDKQPEVARK